MPTLKWEDYQHRLATPEELRSLFAGNVGIAAIAGRVSGNLEVYDFDEAVHYKPWADLVAQQLGSEFLSRLTVVRTPRPGCSSGPWRSMRRYGRRDSRRPRRSTREIPRPPRMLRK